VCFFSFRELTFEAGRMCYWLLQKLPDSAARKWCWNGHSHDQGHRRAGGVIAFCLPRAEERGSPAAPWPAGPGAWQQAVLGPNQEMAVSV